MARLFSRLWERLRGPKRRSQYQRRNHRRRLRVESMEPRRLLAGDMGVIEGVAYTDLLDNGTFQVGTDPVLPVTITLFEDTNTNGTFEPGTDLQVGSPQTVSAPSNPLANPTPQSDMYRFENLTDGTYFVQQTAISGQLQRASETLKTVVISPANSIGVTTQNVDNFDSTTQTLQANLATPTDTDSSVTAGGEAMGGERDIIVNHLSGSNNVDVTVSAGLLSISTGATTTGNAIISYDGVDGNASTIDHSALGNLDLTTGGATAFHFLSGSEAGNTITIDVFSGASNFSSATSPLPVSAGAAATEDLIVRFSDFATGGGTGADFSNVTAIRMQINMAAATDAQFDFTQLVAPYVDTQNFANLNPMTIGNLVFSDFNDNGVQDAGETGISGVDVQLYQDDGATSGSFDGTDTLLTTTTTDASGNYSFGNLLPGDYIVMVPISEFATSSDPLFGYLSSSAGGAFEPAPDPDTVTTNGDDNGTLIAGIGVATTAITLASGTEPTNDGDSDADSDLSIDFGFAPQINLTVTKNTGGVTTVTAGNQLTYTVTVTNNGNAPAANVLVVDDLPDLSPDPLTIVSVNSASGNGVVTQTGNSSGEIEVAYPSLAAGASDTITVVVGVPAAAAAAAAVTNTVTVSGSGIETDPSDNSDTADVAIDRQAALTITKSDTPDPAAVGSNLTYEILVTNTGPSTATNVVISDTLPTGLTYVSSSTTTGTVGESSGVVTANVPTLGVNGSVTVTVVATIASTFSGTTITNTATANADEATLVSANADTTINPQVDLVITKSDSADPVNRGDQFTYTLNLVNNGPSDATNVEVVDTLPTGVTFVSATGGTVTPPSGGSSDVTVAVGSLAASGTATVTITVAVDQSAANSVTNNALVRSTETIAGFETVPGDNTTSESTAIQSTIDLAITKGDSADPVAPGNTYSYTLQVTNNGPSDATQVVVTDVLPDGIQIQSVSSNGTSVVPSSAQDTTAANNDDLTVTFASLAAGATETITINATVLPETRGSINNVASVATTNTALIETILGNNSDNESTTLDPRVDLVVTKTDSPDPVIAGENITYSITVRNDGPSTATNVDLTDALPTGVSFVSATPSQGTASESNGTVTAQFGTLAPSATATLTLVVQVAPDTRGAISNSATASADETELTTGNNTAAASTTVDTRIDLAITKADAADPVAASGSLVYTIVVTNNGPSTATNVVVSDNLPTELSFVSGTSTVGTVSNTGNAVTGSIGTLAPSATATITINATVASSATGTISNTATVAADENELVTSNNSASETTEIAVPGSIAGTVYIDTNSNGVLDAAEAGILGVLLTLTGTDILGATINQTMTTDSSGNYQFSNLLPGTYTITETQPAGLLDSQTNVGTGATGVAGVNEINTIALTSGANAVAFNFGELRLPLSKRRLLASAGPAD